MTRNTEIARAVKRALAISAVAAGAASIPAYAQAQAQVAAAESDTDVLTTVTVTGSRIRRVDLETASPVYTIDHTAIQNSGVATVGELVMQLPSVNGAATNPQVNNGGGFGESYIELRGLDAKRTVVLIDGRRLGLIGDPGSGTSAVDVNQIPLAIIDHVEVLKEGAGAIYGSDAIAGVVNFITRKDINGVEIYADYGRTSADDAAHHQVNVSFGGQGDKFSYMLTGRYEKQDPASQGDRNFSKFSLYNYSNSVFPAGSSRTPTGRINLPAGSPQAAAFGNCDSGSVTKVTGAPATLANYRCFISDGAVNDKYNFAPQNLLVTPQERGSLFTKLNYKINDDVEVYSSVLYNRTHSGFQFAALPFDATADNVVLSKNSIYNPFGIDFGGNSGVNPNASFRLLGAGDRSSDTLSNSAAATLGAKGKVGKTGWEWDLFSMYGRIDQTALISGYYFASALQNAVGPSFIGADGTPTCGTPAAPISGCTPINFFNGNDPTSSTASDRAAFKTVTTGYNTDHTYVTRNIALDLNGKIWSLPAGDIQGSVGMEYRWQEGIFNADQIVQGNAADNFLSCQISQEACTGNSRGHYDNKDFYGEVFVPILKDLPGAKSLNVDLGVRYSDYSIFQKTTRAQFKVEYRPITDLLLRGTFAQVFRAPTIQDAFSAPLISSAQYSDPCNGLTPASLAATPGLARACVNVPTDGSFAEANSQITSLVLSNPNLKPETGEVTTYGFVYDPAWLPNFSTSVDFWRYTINDQLTNLDPNFSTLQCIANGSPFYCGLVTRFGAGANAGQILVYQQPTENVGTLKTNGFDIGLKYNLRSSPVGAFRFTVDVTHVNSYTNNPGGGAATTEYAGIYTVQYGNDAKWRGLASAAWDWRGFDALVSEQWIGKLNLPNGSPGSIPTTNVAIPNIYYTNISVGYTFAPTNTKLQIGVLNTFNREPPLFYAQNVTNANTDVSTYDTLGRRFFVGVQQKF